MSEKLAKYGALAATMALLALAGDAEAQYRRPSSGSKGTIKTYTQVSKSANKTKRYGGSSIGCYVATRSQGYGRKTVRGLPTGDIATVRGSNCGRINMFIRSGTTHIVESIAYQRYSSGWTHNRVVFCGRVIKSSYLPGNQTCDLPMHHRRLFKGSKTFWITFIPITLTFRAKTNLKVTALQALINRLNRQAAVRGHVRNFSTASASAGVGLAFASAGVKFKVKLADTRIEFAQTASRTNVTGGFWTTVEDVKFYIMLYAEFFGAYAKTVLFSKVYGRTPRFFTPLM